MVTDWQKQIVIGSVLGGAKLEKGHMTMKSKNLTWLQYKIEELKEWFKKEDIQNYQVSAIIPYEIPDINTTLDMLRDIGLAIWFMDGGGMTGRSYKNAYFNGKRFGAEVNIICDYFNNMQMACKVNSAKKIIFSVEGSNSLLKVILPCLPPFLLDSMS